MSRRKCSAWPPAPSWATSCDRTSDAEGHSRLHHAPLGRILLGDVLVSASLVREDYRARGALPTMPGPVCVSVDDFNGGDGFRISLAGLGRRALVDALIEATTDGPVEGGVLQ